jgi:hypothetical protein
MRFTTPLAENEKRVLASIVVFAKRVTHYGGWSRASGCGFGFLEDTGDEGQDEADCTGGPGQAREHSVADVAESHQQAHNAEDCKNLEDCVHKYWIRAAVELSFICTLTVALRGIRRSPSFGKYEPDFARLPVAEFSA